MALPKQKQFIKNLIKLQSQLSALRFPAFGNLYFRDSLREHDLQVPLGRQIDSSGLFCVGPSAHHDLLHPSEDGRFNETFGCVPLPYLSLLGVTLVEREMKRIANLPDDDESDPEYTKEQRLNILRSSVTMMKALDSCKLLTDSAFPAMWRQNIDLDDIFVSQDDPTLITSIIGWRSVDISPLFFRVGIPYMLYPPDGYRTGLEETAQPCLPDDFASCPAEEQDEIRINLKRCLATKFYERMSSMLNPIAYQAIQIPFCFDMYQAAAHASGDEQEWTIHSIERSLISLYQSWNELGLQNYPNCPITFTKEEIAQHETRNEIYRVWLDAMGELYRELGTGSNGFIPWNKDFDEARRRNKEIFESWLTEGGDREQLKSLWPFPDSL